MTDLDLIPILEWHRPRPGELGSDTLWGLAPHRTYIALDKSELTQRMRRAVDAGQLPAAALATVDSGVSPEILKRLGYSREDLAKAAREVETLFKGASARLLRQEDIEPGRRPGRMVKVDSVELERLRKVARIVEKFLDGPRRVDPALREAADDLDEREDDDSH